MMKRGLFLAASALTLVLAPQRATAAEIALEGQLGYFRMAATESASAVFDATGGLTFGGALRGTFWRGFYVSAGARTFSKSGERVFVASSASPVQKLGFPLTMRTTPILLSVGYRFRHDKTIVPYLSGGGALTAYSERSEVAGETFDVDHTKLGFVAATGFEVGRGMLRFGGEVGYSTVPNVIANGGVSRVYGESNIGGLHVVGKIVFALTAR